MGAMENPGLITINETYLVDYLQGKKDN